MSEEKKQKTDDDTAELGSVLQLSPHTPTSKLNVISRGEDGTEYISLDDVFEVNGQEALQVLAANCREYNKNKRLHQSGFSALLISGTEGLVPGYDRLNTIKGGESWLEALKKGFVIIIKAAKRFILAVIDWVILKIKTILGFNKTEKELVIVAEMTEGVKQALVSFLGDIAKTEKHRLDTEELFANLPPAVTTIEAFSIVQNKTKTVLEQMDILNGFQTELVDAEKAIYDASNNARTSRARYQQAIRKLRDAFKDKETFSNADILEFTNAIDKEMIEYLNPDKMTQMLKTIVDKVYGIDLGNVGLDKSFKDKLREHRESLNATAGVRVTPEQYEQYRKYTASFAKILMQATQDRIDPASLASIKDLIEVGDAELLDNIQAIAPGSSILGTSYTAYAARIAEYSATLEYLITIVGQVRRSLAGAVNWANKVDKLMISYITKDISTIVKLHEQYLTDETRNLFDVVNDKGETVDSIMTASYDEMLITKHKYYGGFLLTYRGLAADFRKRNKVFDVINTQLRKLGIRQGI